MKEIEKSFIKKYLEENFPDKNLSIKLIKNGYNQNVYQVTNSKDNEKFITRIGNHSRDSGSSLENHIRALMYFEYKNIKYTPKIISYNLKKSISIESFLGTNDLLVENFSSILLKKFANQLVEIHSLEAKDYLSFCKKNKLGSVVVQNLIKEKKTYCIDRFSVVKRLHKDKKLIEFIYKEIDSLYKGVAKTKNERPHLIWGDVGNNFRVSGNRLYFIDWEFSRIGYGNELAYIKVHTHLSASQFERLLSFYADASKNSREKLEKDISIEEKKIRLNDIIWAAMKSVQSTTENDTKKFDRLTNKRRKLYKQLYGAQGGTRTRTY